MKELKQAFCSNCRAPYRKEDQFCRFCGAPMKADFRTPMPPNCIYGPPPTQRTHVCRKCGYQWKTYAMLDRERFCPKCGGNAPITEEEDLW